MRRGRLGLASAVLCALSLAGCATSSPSRQDYVKVETAHFEIQLQETGVGFGQVAGFSPDSPVAITVTSPALPSEPYEMIQCDAEGRFELTGLRAGEYAIRAVQVGRASPVAEQTVTVNAGEELVVTLTP